MGWWWSWAGVADGANADGWPAGDGWIAAWLDML
jgi:hypothetical protein